MMQSRAWIAFVLVALGACVGDDPAAGNGSSSGEPSADGGSTSSGGSSGTPPPPPPPGCDGRIEPSRDACVLHESFGVFVAATGSDEAAGTREAPFATLGHALAAAQAAGKRVYICAGAYTEGTVQLRSGVSIYGGLACDQALWTVSPTARVVLRTTASPALRAKDIATDTTVEGIDVIAPDGAEPGASSIGLIAENTIGLRFVRSSITAGSGADGADGVEPAPYTGSQSPAPGAGTTGAVSETQIPAVAPTNRGGGGRCVRDAEPPELQANAGGKGCSCTVFRKRMIPGSTPTLYEYVEGTCEDRVVGTGDEAVDGPNGSNGDTFLIDANGYLGTNGHDGQAGQSGRGGNGGQCVGIPRQANWNSPTYVRPSFGSGGGAGGCPGLSGTAGQAGGASISVAAFSSLITLDATLIQSARAGLGGKGALGSAPTNGWPAGTCGDGILCGGEGKPGSKSGWSGHGLSGASIGIAYTGTEPTRSEDSVITVAAARDGQPALTGNGKTIPAGTAGTSAEVYVIPPAAP